MTNMATLVGSEKQVSWATQIRAKAVENLMPLRKVMEDNAAKNPAIAKIAMEIIDTTLANTSASYWIDNRTIDFNRNWLNRATIAKRNENV